MIKAKIHSDDYVFEYEFDGTPWFKEASLEDLHRLYAEGWCSCIEADQVAIEASNGPMTEETENIKFLIDYCQRKGEGFEVEIDELSVLGWLKSNRPDVLLEV
jgi:hypothetical protein